MTEPGFKGAVFDLDGVITQTAQLHFRAWKDTFDNLLAERADDDAKPFTHDGDYIPYVDGKPRYQGVKSFLESRSISLPFGDPDDDPGDETICAVGNRKNERFRELVKEEGAEVFESSIRLVDELRERGVAVAGASSSRDAAYIMEQAGIKEKFGAIVDGTVSHELGLKGKPDPDIFLLAAERIGTTPVETMMVEDAYAGVEAGLHGGFGLVLGVARGADRERLLHYGADIVVDDLTEISMDELTHWFAERLPDACWHLTYHGFHDEEERLREALTTVGNGYFGTRGSLESEAIDDNIHNPGTYVAGLFDRAGSEVHGRVIENNDLVNCPNWTHTTVHINDGPALSPHTCETISYRHWLDVRGAIMHHDFTLRDDEGRITAIHSERFASMDRPHLGAMRLSVRPVNHAQAITIRTSLDGDVRNFLVERYRELEQHHLEPVTAEARDDGAYLEMRTINSGHAVCMRARTHMTGAEAHREIDRTDRRVTEVFSLSPREDHEVIVDRLVAIHTGKDFDTNDPRAASETLIGEVAEYEEERGRHRGRWSELWKDADIVVEGDRFAQKVLRLHACHLLSSASPNNAELDVGLPARGLHGEAYRGHIFWDETFIMPFYTLRFPEVAKSHLLYRYRRLDPARALAKEEGYEGAMYPWQSADTGGPESQELHYNPRSGDWDPDLSKLQRHISISIAYDVFTYFYTTGDTEFLHECGMEMMLEIARFWASIAEFDDADGRYHIRGVMGPDEFHEKYPDAPLDEGGFNDNSYTNVMAAWLLHKIAETYEHLPDGVKDELRGRIGFEPSETERWHDIVRGMKVVFDHDGLMAQFDGYMDLKELDWDEYRHKYENIRRMDRILKAEGDSPDRYKVSKQADVLMMFYLLAPDQVEHILETMGYDVESGKELLRTNYEYYVQRTSHGSTLSWIVHSAILRYLDEHKNDQWNWFVECLKSDVFDTQGGTTLEGIHCGVMAGSIDIVLTSFAGVNLFRDHLELDPELPDGWTRVELTIVHRGARLRIEVEREEQQSVAYVTRLDSGDEELSARSEGTDFALPVGKRVKIAV
ncbi:MAG: beta-phosphoglucomutase family hydrolase [Spirochaetota bacterium]